MRHFFDILEIPPGSSYKQVRQAYRDAMRVWHPDFFQSNPTLQKRAEEKTKEIIFAYHHLTRNWAEINERLRREEEAANASASAAMSRAENDARQAVYAFRQSAPQQQPPQQQHADAKPEAFRQNRWELREQTRISLGRSERLESCRSVFLVILITFAVMSPKELWEWVLTLVVN